MCTRLACPDHAPSLTETKLIKVHRLLLNPFMSAPQVDCEVGEVNAEGLRGVRARRDMKLHQVAVKLPKVMAITLKEWNVTSEVQTHFPQYMGLLGRPCSCSRWIL